MTQLVDWERASTIMDERDIDILLGAGFVNYGYLAGYFTHFGMDYPGPLADGTPLVRLAGLPRDPSLSPFLVTYPDEEWDMIAYGSWIEDRWYWGQQYNLPGTEALKGLEDPVDCLAQALAERGLAEGRVGLDLWHASAALTERIREAIPNAAVVDAGEAFGALRMVKTPPEVERLRGAVAAVEGAHRVVRESLREGMTELELAAIAKKAVIDARTDRYIVHACFGEKGATVLAPTDRRLKKGELVLVDCGCVHRAYIGDMARVYAYGEPPPDAVKVHEAMDKVNGIIVESVGPGLKASELYGIGAAAMKSGGLEMSLEFAGHGIGLDVHEPPFLVPDNHTILRPNMVIVIEMATRRPDLGLLCAEIPVLVTEDGAEVLSSLPIELTQVE